VKKERTRGDPACSVSGFSGVVSTNRDYHPPQRICQV
jgi:hypothetical protein